MIKIKQAYQKLNAVVLLAQGKLTNPALQGDWGSNSTDAKSGSLFITIAVNFWRAAMTLGGLYVLGSFVLAAFTWITSGNETQGAEKARSILTNAVIGLVILVTSFTLVTFIGDLLFGDQFSLLEFTLPTPESTN